MKRLAGFSFALLVSFPFVTFAQNDAAVESAAAPAEARQFDFLLGEWAIEVHPKVSSLIAMIHGTPRLIGTWKAWRTLDNLGIEDEMRIVDASGNPVSLNRARRTYAKGEARWKVSSVDVTHSRNSESSGRLQGNEMHLDGHSTDPGGNPILTRIRYYDITAEAFRMRQDRSTDNGQSWEEGVLTIDARRTAATARP
jgi:hypothetical protein